MTENTARREQADVAYDLCAQAKSMIAQGRHADARRCLEKSLKQERTAEALRCLGLIEMAREDWDKAAGYLEEALEIDINHADTLATVGELMLHGYNDWQQAVGHYMLAIQADPSETRYQQRFLNLIVPAQLTQFNPHLARMLEICLAASGLHLDQAVQTWYTTFLNHPDFRGFFKPGLRGDEGVFNPDAFRNKKAYRKLMKPYFMDAARQIIVPASEFEAFMVRLRRFLLEERPRDALPLVAAVSDYCFSTEYIFDTTPEEDAQAQALRARIEQADRPDAMDVALYACYAPLHTLANAQDVARALSGVAELESPLRRQIAHYLEIQDIRGRIQAITPIKDETTQKVRAQYEDFPYPRWQTFAKADFPPHIVNSLIDRNAQVLIAGCGTGHQAAYYAASLPGRRVLAVDISLSSLAYATLKARQFGLDNLEFRQADILELGGIGRTFDHIACTGVLHHMSDPEKGWKTLVDILKPGGTMLVALYSERARAPFAEAQQAAAKGGYAGDRAGMLKFRRDVKKLVSPDTYTYLRRRARDYYSLSMFRDLLFHVHERRFTLPQVAEMMERLGLEFMGFSHKDGETLFQKYREAFPGDPAMTNLANWDAFERDNPSTFICMYSFWCRKK